MHVNPSNASSWRNLVSDLLNGTSLSICCLCWSLPPAYLNSVLTTLHPNKAIDTCCKIPLYSRHPGSQTASVTEPPSIVHEKRCSFMWLKLPSHCCLEKEVLAWNLTVWKMVTTYHQMSQSPMVGKIVFLLLLFWTWPPTWKEQRDCLHKKKIHPNAFLLLPCLLFWFLLLKVKLSWDYDVKCHCSLLLCINVKYIFVLNTLYYLTNTLEIGLF